MTDPSVASSMEGERLGEVEKIPVYLDRHACRADGIVVINRVKPHQVFKGEIQSGLNKMMALGLGKKKGADRGIDGIRWVRTGSGCSATEAVRGSGSTRCSPSRACAR